MTGHAKRYVATLAGLGLMVLMMAFPAVAAATTNEPIAQTGGASASIPLLGTTLDVDVTLTATGDINTVTLSDPGFTQSSTSAEVVKFSNADGTTTVTVKARGDTLAIKAKSKQLSNIVGAGTWKAKVFGGSQTTVPYTVGDDGSGNPTLAIGSVSAPAGETSVVTAPTTKTWGNHVIASGSVEFSSNGFDKTLRITVTVDKNDGDASLSLKLSGRDRQILTGTAADLAAAGPRTWTGHLPDGTAVSVVYHVTADGKVVYDSATGGPVTEKDFSDLFPAGTKFWCGDRKFWLSSSQKPSGTIAGGFVVRFTGTNVGFAAWLKDNGDGTFTLIAKGHSGDSGKGFGNGDASKHHGHGSAHGNHGGFGQFADLGHNKRHG